MSLKDVRYILGVAIFAGLLTYLTIDRELEYERERLDQVDDCQPKLN
jgi:hypothetical protein